MPLSYAKLAGVALSLLSGRNAGSCGGGGGRGGMKKLSAVPGLDGALLVVLRRSFNLLLLVWALKSGMFANVLVFELRVEMKLWFTCRSDGVESEVSMVEPLRIRNQGRSWEDEVVEAESKFEQRAATCDKGTCCLQPIVEQGRRRKTHCCQRNAFFVPGIVSSSGQVVHVAWPAIARHRL